MEFKFMLRLSVVFVIFTAVTINAKVKAVRRVVLRSLSAEEVVKILKLAGREDAIPEGRVVTQGLAAITGFALGLTKGIGGSLLFDLAASNATSQFINNFNATAMMGDFQGIDMTSLVQKFQWGAANNSTAIRYKTTEICFDTRNGDAIVEETGRQPRLASPAHITPYARASPISSKEITDGLGTGFTGTGTDDGTETDTGTGTNTNTNTITETDNDGSSETCIVLQKPILRKRRSSPSKRKR